MRKIGSKELTERIAALRNEKKVAIENLDFSNLEAIDKEIQEQKEQAIEIAIQEIKDQYYDAIITSIRNFESKYDVVEKDFYTKRNKIRQHYYVIFEEMKRKHLEELVVLEQNLIEARDKENFRSIPEKDEKIHQAREAATNGNYQKAEQLKKEASLIPAEILQSRLEKCQADFENARKCAMEKDEKVIKEMNTNFTNEMAELSERHFHGIEEISQNREANLISITQKYINKFVQSEFFTAEDVKPQLIEILEQICNDESIPMPQFPNNDLHYIRTALSKSRISFKSEQ